MEPSALPRKARITGQLTARIPLALHSRARDAVTAGAAISLPALLERAITHYKAKYSLFYESLPRLRGGRMRAGRKRPAMGIAPDLIVIMEEGDFFGL
jgi:hypothetical protein